MRGSGAHKIWLSTGTKPGYNGRHCFIVEGIRVVPETKSNFIHKIFSEVPRTYELVNHILTFGLDIIWRRRAAAVAAEGGGERWIDMCTGTGETAIYLQRLAPAGTLVCGLDFSLPMLTEAGKKSAAGNIHFVASDVKMLPFADESFDLVTISFATRNINLSRDILVQSFSEFHRILKPGGRFVNLETSRPSSAPLRKGLQVYVKLIVKSIGSRISGSKPAYTYLAGTIPRFYSPEELAGIMRLAGFVDVSFRRQLFGVAAIHHGMKSTAASASPSDRSKRRD
jgi:demethylmenaquinone methyltransferase/2-methoxy-6-polyprenyl-1,4-benzoquinol methylase